MTARTLRSSPRREASAQTPAWFLDLEANPEISIEVGDRKLRVRAEVASPEDKPRLWAKLTEMYPTYDANQKTERENPVASCTRWCSAKTKRSIVNTISRENLRKKIERGDDFVLLEVLSEASYRQAHLPGANRFRSMDLIPELLPDKTTDVVAYCSTFN